MAINLQVAVRLQDLFSRPLTTIQSATRNATTALNNFNTTSNSVKGANLNEMTNSIGKMREAFYSLEEKKRQISIWDTSGIKKYNEEIARLKESIGKAKKAQGEINVAMRNGNAEKIRQSYNEFNEEVRKTENIVKKNTKGQNKFNNSIAKGNNEAQKGNIIFSGLGRKIIAFASTYASFKSISSTLDLSDTMTQTTARLDMMNDGKQSTSELQEKIFAAAQRSRGSYQASADAISKMGIMAGDAFNSNDELIGFVEQLNKQFTIAGTSQEGISAAMLQLTQAMGSGVLRGEELNSVFEQAPTIIQSIADYMKIPIGQIRNMAQEGKLSASVVKTALLSSADATNEKFNKMPMTFGQITTSIKNQALMSFQPILKRINEIGNSQSFQKFINSAINDIDILADMATIVFKSVLQIGERLASVGNTVKNNWSKIAPILIPIAVAIGAVTAAIGIYNLAMFAASTATTIATIAQNIFNTALWACPLTWIIIGIVAVIGIIYLAVVAFNKLSGSSVSATGIISGSVAAIGAFIFNMFLAVQDIVKGVLEFLYNGWIAFGNFFSNVFKDPIGSVIRLFGDFGDRVLGIIEKIAKAIDDVFGSNLSGAVSDLRGTLLEGSELLANTLGNGEYEEKIKKLNIDEMLDSAGLGIDRINYGDAFDWGAGIGEKIDSFFSGKDDKLKNITEISNMNNYLSGNDISNIGEVENVKNVKGTVDVTSEDLKYLRDIAEQESINQFTTKMVVPDVKITFTGDIRETADVEVLSEAVKENIINELTAGAEGVHV